jgi:RND family efflux transporter MFP subunit
MSSIPQSGAARIAAATLLLATAAALAGCGGDADGEAKAFVRKTPITSAEARNERVDAIERTVGRVESLSTPALSAETSGRVVRLLVDGGSQVRKGQVLAELDGEPQRLAVASARANVARLQATLDNQRRTVDRYQELRSQAVSESMLEEAVSRRTSLEAELADAQARLAEAEYRYDRTRIRAPVDAVVERRLISVGDFVAPGTPIVTIVGRGELRAVLPFPERLAGQLRPGLPVTLQQPSKPDQPITGTVTEVRPMVGTNNRAVEALVDLPDGVEWPAGGSVGAELVLASRQAVVVPANSVVRRPVGDVVYVLDGDKAAERRVTIGIRTATRVEVLNGLAAGERVALSGAGFLSDGALVALRDAPPGD